METLKVLHLEDDPLDFELVKQELENTLKINFEFKQVENKDDFIHHIENWDPGLIICDYSLPQYNGLAALKDSKEINDSIPFIFVTGTLSEEIAAESIKSGAWDYVVKERLVRLPIAVNNALDRKKQKEEQKRNQEALAKSEEKFRLIAENSIDCIWQMDKRLHFTYLSPSLYTMSGFKPEEWVGTPLWKHMKWLEFAKIGRMALKMIREYKTHGSSCFEIKMINKNGHEFPVEITAKPLLGKENKLTGLQGTTREISEKRKSELKLLEQRNEIIRQLRFTNTLINSLPNSLFYKDLNGKYLGCNKAFTEMIGISNEEIIGKTVYDLWPEQRAKLYIENDKELLETEKNQVNELEIIDKDNKKRDVIFEKALFYDENDEPVGIIGVYSDITARKKTEVELIQAKEKAEESDKLKSAFLATMSHELRTPLNAIIGFSDLIDEEMPLDEILKMTANINEQGLGLLHIIEAMFEISMLEAENIKVDYSEINIEDFFKDIYSYFEYELRQAKKDFLDRQFIVENARGLKHIKTDPEMLRKLTEKLLQNAIKFTSSGKITFGYFVEEESIKIIVRDTGIGIPEEKQGIIFDKFVQGDDSHTRLYGGIGVGLALAKKMTVLLGGNISFESQEKMGSTFYIHLPIKEGFFVEVSDNINKQYIDKTESIIKGKSILVAEDEASNFLLVDTLLKRKGAKVTWVKNGKDAVELVKEGNLFDLVLMDLKMPVMNGFEATVEIKSINSKQAIVALTAYALAGDDQKALQCGCSDYLQKPFKKEIFYQMVENNLVNNSS